MNNATLDAAADPERRNGSDAIAGERTSDWSAVIESLTVIGAETVMERAEEGVNSALEIAPGLLGAAHSMKGLLEQDALGLASHFSQEAVRSLASSVRAPGFTKAFREMTNLASAASALSPDMRDALIDLDSDGTTALASALRGFLAARKFAPSSSVERAGPWADTNTVRGYLGGISRQAINKRVASRKILACKFRDENLYYPTRQFTQGGVVDGLKEVLDALSQGIDSPEVWATWLAGPSSTGKEGLTGWDDLLNGHKDALLAEARQDASLWAA